MWSLHCQWYFWTTTITAIFVFVVRLVLHYFTFFFYFRVVLAFSSTLLWHFYIFNHELCVILLLLAVYVVAHKIISFPRSERVLYNLFVAAASYFISFADYRVRHIVHVQLRLVLTCCLQRSCDD